MSNGRFSDKMLFEFHEEFVCHVRNVEERRALEEERYDKLLSMQEANASAIQQLIAETKGIVELHRDIQGAVRIGTSVQKLVLWLAKWGVTGAFIAGVIQWSGGIIDKIITLFNIGGGVK